MSQTSGLIQGLREFTDYLAVEHGAARSTIDAYHGDLTQLVAVLESEGITTWASVTGTHLSSFLAGLTVATADGPPRKASASTKARKFAAIRTFFGWAFSTRRVAVNPCAEDIRPSRSAKNMAPRILTDDEIARVLAATTPGSRDHAIVAVLTLGLSPTEVARLKVGDVSLEQGRLTVRPVSDGAAVKDHGGAQSPRIVELTETVCRALHVYLAQTRPAIKRNRTEAHLFLNYAGRPMSRQCPWKVLTEAGRKSGVGAISPQLMRTTFAVSRLSSGVDVATVSQQMGHADISTTQRYQHIALRRTQRA